MADIDAKIDLIMKELATKFSKIEAILSEHSGTLSKTHAEFTVIRDKFEVMSNMLSPLIDTSTQYKPQQDKQDKQDKPKKKKDKKSSDSDRETKDDKPTKDDKSTKEEKPTKDDKPTKKDKKTKEEKPKKEKKKKHKIADSSSDEDIEEVKTATSMMSWLRTLHCNDTDYFDGIIPHKYFTDVKESDQYKSKASTLATEKAKDGLLISMIYDALISADDKDILGKLARLYKDSQPK